MSFRWTSISLGLLIALAPFAFSQEPTSAQTPEDAFSARELVAWSRLQKPQPAPQPLPPRDTPIPQPDPSSDQQSKAPADQTGEARPGQSFSGRVVKEGNEYVLRMADNTTYQLDEQGGMDRYEDKRVRVVGTLDRASNTIHVLKIELIS